MNEQENQKFYEDFANISQTEYDLLHLILKNLKNQAKSIILFDNELTFLINLLYLDLIKFFNIEINITKTNKYIISFFCKTRNNLKDKIVNNFYFVNKNRIVYLKNNIEEKEFIKINKNILFIF